MARLNVLYKKRKPNHVKTKGKAIVTTCANKLTTSAVVTAEVSALITGVKLIADSPLMIFSFLRNYSL